MRSLDNETLALALGHALGRAVLAQGEDRVRQEAVACLVRGLEQMYWTFPGIYSKRDALYDLIRYTAAGWNDDLVKKRTGIATRSPAYSVFGASGPGGAPNITPPLPSSQPRPGQQPIQPVRSSTGVPKCLSVYDYWGIKNAEDLVYEATRRERLARDCYSTVNYLECRQITDLTWKALDNVTQWFARVRDSQQYCLLCDMVSIRPKPSAIGRRVDDISERLYRKGMKSTVGGGWEAQYANLEREPFCGQPGGSGGLSISPVSKADCPKHCADAGPRCNYAYYVTGTRTCSWADNQAAPNLSALASGDIWDRAKQRWLSQPVKPTPPSSPVFVLDKVVYSKYQTSTDLCKADMKCKHEKRAASGDEIEDYYSISEGTASYRFKVTRQRTGEVLSNYAVQFSFDAPPSIIRPGEKLLLKANGDAVGFTRPCHLNRSFTYYIKQGGQNNYHKKTMVHFSNRELPYDGALYKGRLSKASTTEITIPKNPGKELIIGGKAGWDPGLYVDWVYKPR
jgi:hypothetical protein